MDVERISDAREVIDTNAHMAFLDAPDVRFAGADHLGKAVLRKPLAFPSLPDRFSERASFLVDVHAYRICARLSAVASYMVPLIFLHPPSTVISLIQTTFVRIERTTMEKILKYPLALVLAAVLAFGAVALAGCSSGSSSSGSGVTVKSENTSQGIDQGVSIEKTTLIDIPEASITADSVSFENDNLCVNLTLTNKTNKPLQVNAGNMGFPVNYINNYMVNGGYLYTQLEPNESTTDSISFDTAELQGLGIKQIGEIGLGLTVKNNQTTPEYSEMNFDQICQQVATIKTDKIDSVDMNADTYPEAINNQALLTLLGASMVKFNGEGGFDQNGISIKSIALMKSVEDKLAILVEIQNNTDKLVSARASDVIIDGEMSYEGLWSNAALAPHKIGLLDINLDDILSLKNGSSSTEGEGTHLESVKTVEIEFSVIDEKRNTIVSPTELEFSF